MSLHDITLGHTSQDIHGSLRDDTEYNRGTQALWQYLPESDNHRMKPGVLRKTVATDYQHPN